MKYFLSLILLFWGALSLIGCALSEQARKRELAERELADTTVWNEHSQQDLLIEDNRKLSKIIGLDTILCRHVAATDGAVIFDEPLWKNLRVDQRKSLIECLDLKRNIRVSSLSPLVESERLWTARLSDDQQRLLIGYVLSNCITCSLSEGKVEYRLTPQDTLYVPTRIQESEMWR
jgi:hypothetical protein